MLRDRLRTLLDERRQGFSLPQALYVDDEIFQADLEAVFATDWLFACNVCEIKRPGDYLTLEIGANSVVILRDRDGEVRAFHNTCRHRGLPHLQRGDGPCQPARLSLSPMGL